jgi:hypothetical protein
MMPAYQPFSIIRRALLLCALALSVTFIAAAAVGIIR